MVKRRKLNSSKNRILRSRSPQSGDEVVTARDRFKGALLDLLPRSDEDSESSGDDSKSWTNRSKRSSPQKKISERLSQEQSGFKQAFIMKLYDRTVDLSNFTDTTPLYPICRAWIANQSTPQPSRKDDSVNDELKDDIKDDPDPTKRLYNKLPGPSYKVNGSNKIRVPDPLPRLTNYPTVTSNPNDRPSKEELLMDNLSHWNRVRESWTHASRLNEHRYSRSISILNDIFYNAQKSF